MRSVGAALLICLFGALYSTCEFIAGEAPRSIVVSPAQELAWGEEALRTFLLERPESTDRTVVEKVRRVGHRIADVSDRPTLLYRFFIVRSIGEKDLQAFSFPGGTVCLTESLARFYASEDELAFALGHEIAHTVLRHHVSQARMLAALESGAPGAKALLGAVKGAFALDTEMEADRFGALYAVRAGFRYTATYEAHDRLGKALHGPDSHPEILKRVEALKAFRRELELSLEAFESGIEALRGRKPDEAIERFRYFVAEFPNSVAGRVNLGMAYLARVRLEAGTPLGLSEVLPLLPEPGVVVRAVVDVRDLERARDNFRSALRVQPLEALAEAGLGLVQTRFGELEPARSHLRKARFLAPARWDLPLCLGNVEYLSEDYEEAAGLYLEALRLHPGWYEATKNLALAYEKLDRPSMARELWLTLVSHPRIGEEAKQHVEQLKG